jgi:hypothetical protein
MGRYPSSLGSSMKSLEKIFSIPDLKLQLKEEENRNIINFSSVIDGDEADTLNLQIWIKTTNTYHMIIPKKLNRNPIHFQNT